MIYILSALGILSLILNIFFIWYIREMIGFIAAITSDMSDLYTECDKFQTHLDGVYNLETFYGDNTLQSLLKHAGDLKVEMKEFITTNEQYLINREEN